MTFKELGLGEKLQEALGYMGFENATPIQEQAIPKILAGKDLLACAQTGTGKTAAFILPILELMSRSSSKHVRTVVIAPTRELALQIEQQVQAFAYFVDVSSISIYGGGDGQEFDEQKKALVRGCDVIVATPGKLISHLNMGYVNFKEVEYLILDEADRMLDMGFFDDIQTIVSHMTENRQTLLFSATFPPKIKKLGKSILKDPEEIAIAISKPAAGVLQAAYMSTDYQKPKLIRKLINDKPAYSSIIIFTSTKKKVNDIVRAISNQGYKVQAVSSDLVQKDREDALKRFRSKETRVLVATDVLSRGIDVKDINLVINYDVPRDAADYVHRVGRTARADTTGVALTLVNEQDMYHFKQIENLIEQEIAKAPMPPEFGEAPVWNPNAKKMRPGGGGGRNSNGRSGGGRKGGRSGNRSGGGRSKNYSKGKSSNRSGSKPYKK